MEEPIKIEKGALKEEFPALVAFLNKIFKTDFRKLLPKIYRTDRYLGQHYFIKNKGKFAANVASIPLTLRLYGKELNGRAIGMVAVDKKARGKGYMSALLTRATEDAKKEGVDFMVLSGNRQRYENFGFTPAGYRYEFTLTPYVKRHVKPPERFSFRKIDESFEEMENLFQTDQERPIGFVRERSDFFKTLASWKRGNGIYAVYENETLFGYVIRSFAKLVEVSVKADAEQVCLDFSRKYKVDRFVLFPDDAAGTEALANLCEKCKVVCADSFKILNFKNTAEKLLAAAAAQKKLCDFSIVIETAGERFRLGVQNGEASACRSEEKPDYVFTEKEAVSYLFSPIFSALSPLPFSLPLYIKESDNA